MLRKWPITLLFFALLIVSTVAAQDAAAPQTYLSYDGWLSFEYPAGWVVNSEADQYGLGLLTLASSQDALDVIEQNSEQETNDPVPVGDAAIIIARPEFLSRLTSGFDPSMPLLDVLTAFVTAPEDTGITAKETTVAGYPALRMDAADETSAGIILAMQFAPGLNFLMAASTTPDDLPQYEDTIMAIAESVHFGGLAETFMVHDYRVWGAGWNADGSLFYTRGTDFLPDGRFVRVWDGETYEELYRLEARNAEFSPDGTQIAATFDGPTQILDARTGDLIVEIGKASDVLWKTDGSQILATDFAAAEISVWDVETGERLLKIDYKTSSLDWAFDETQIVTRMFGDDAEVIYWDAETGERRLTVPGAGAITLNADSTRMFYTVYTDAEASLVLAAYPSGEEIWRSPIDRNGHFTSTIIAPQWNADETRIFGNYGSCGGSGDNCTLSGYVWDAEMGELLFSTPANEDETYRAGVYLDNGQVVGGLRGPDVIKVWDSNTGEVVKELPTADFIYRMVFSPERQQLFAFEDTGLVRVYDVETWQQVMALPHEDRVKFGFVRAENPDRFISETEDGAYTVWDLTTGRELLRIGHNSRAAQDVLVYDYLSPDGSRLLTFSSDSLATRVFRPEDLIAGRLAAYAAEPYTAAELDQMGYEALSGGNYEEAIQLYTEALREDPDAFYALNGRGFSYYRLGDVQAALNDINRAIVIDPTFVQGIKNQGDIWRLQGDNEEAVKSYNRALELAPENPQLYNIRGVAYANLKDYPAAIADFDAAIAIDAAYAQAYSNRAFVYSFMERNEEALQSLEVYIELIGGEANANEDVFQLLDRLRGAVE